MIRRLAALVLLALTALVAGRASVQVGQAAGSAGDELRPRGPEQASSFWSERGTSCVRRVRVNPMGEPLAVLTAAPLVALARVRQSYFAEQPEAPVTWRPDQRELIGRVCGRRSCSRSSTEPPIV